MTVNHISIRAIAATLGLAFLASSVATSSSFAYSARAQQMCTGDAMRLCSSEIPNVSRIIACMRRNKANVSAGCRAVMEQEDPASRPKPVQAAPVETKLPATARAEQPAPVKPKPVQAAPVEPKLPAAARIEQPVQVAPVPAAPVEHKPVVAATAPQPAAVAARPASGESFEQTTVAVPPAEQRQRPRINPFRHLAGQKPAALAILARAAVTEAKLAVAAGQKPATAAPVAATEPKPVQVSPAASTPPAAAPVAPPAAPAAVKPAEVKPAPVARPVKVVQRKQKTRQVAVASYTPRDGGGYERYIGMAAPIMSLIMSYW